MISRITSYFTSLVDNFGYRFSITLISIYGCLKGMMYQVVSNASLPYFKKLGVTGTQLQSLRVLAATPWAMKAAIGLLSDVVAIMGYHKLSYIAIVSIIGSAALCSLWLIPFPAALAAIAALLLFFVNLQVATVDLLAEAKYAELMASKPHTGSQVVSYVWGLFSVGSLIGSIVTGPLADNYNPRILYAIATPLAAQVIIPVITGWFPDERISSTTQRCQIRTDKLNTHPHLVRLAGAITMGALIVGVTAALDERASALNSSTNEHGSILMSSVSVGTAITMAVLGYLWLPETIRHVNLYLFLNNVLYLSLSGALDYFFTANETCVPDGPHFSNTYYITWANIVGSIASLAGVTLFQRVLNGRTFRLAFCVGTIVKLAASMFDYAIVKRWNTKVLGISDRTFFMLGDAVISQVVGMLDLMPAVVLTSKVVTKGMEASVYALLVSYQNFGSGVASTVGGELTKALKIRTTIPCNFNNLPQAILIAHVLLPALSFPLIFLLIPNARMTDDLSGNGDINSTDEDFTTSISSDEDFNEDDVEKHDTTALMTTEIPSPRPELDLPKDNITSGSETN